MRGCWGGSGEFFKFLTEPRKIYLDFNRFFIRFGFASQYESLYRHEFAPIDSVNLQFAPRGHRGRGTLSGDNGDGRGNIGGERDWGGAGDGGRDSAASGLGGAGGRGDLPDVLPAVGGEQEDAEGSAGGVGFALRDNGTKGPKGRKAAVVARPGCGYRCSKPPDLGEEVERGRGVWGLRLFARGVSPSTPASAGG